ncbi:zinc-dependent metalloprotease [Kineococcus glutinatus]|uniref:Zinc-dependent metalloprotease n=1 Tax=Kineococcus glutinatus TaxID=1070872 RepID=A0ABP8VM25_9ACTN
MTAPPDEQVSTAVGSLVDFDVAARTAARLVRPGPAVRPAEVAEAVESLRRSAAEAVVPVEEVSRLRRDPAVADEGPALVVDRPSWARANVEGFRALLAPVRVPLPTGRGGRAVPLDRAAVALGRRTTGAELGGMLAFLAGKVLGQFDAFSGADSQRPGRLLLVVPNVVQVERELDVPPADFRLWVCLHEETHRLQFAANPWLRGWVVDEARALAGEVLAQPRALAQRLQDVARQLPDVLRGSGSGPGLLDLLQSPRQRERVRSLVAVMSVLEGHADVVMDDVGPQVVPSVARIRERFTQRRRGRGSLDQVARRLLGLEAKSRQYADGARFVRGVTARVGTEGFNAVWQGPGALPTPAEIADPRAWVRRVHG